MSWPRRYYGVTFTTDSGIAGISGRVENLMFRTTADARTYAQQAPARTKQPGTPAQQQWRKGTFREAVAYGNAQKRDPAGIAYYEQFRVAGSFNSMYNLALADYTKPPEVRAVEIADYREQAGHSLRVRAHDPYGIVAVRVQVLDAAGQTLEEGEATATGEGWWEYITCQTHTLSSVRQVRGLAFDRPGNAAAGITELVAD